jgi:ribosomal protein RSM22 (predicted rRNA methylase)
LARLVRSPRPHKGHVRVVLCEAEGLVERVISRRDGDRYRRARDARWGDRLELDPPI